MIYIRAIVCLVNVYVIEESMKLFACNVTWVAFGLKEILNFDDFGCKFLCGLICTAYCILDIFCYIKFSIFSVSGLICVAIILLCFFVIDSYVK